MAQPNFSSSFRVLARPPVSPASASAPTSASVPAIPPPSPTSIAAAATATTSGSSASHHPPLAPSPPSEGVVVVGFVGSKPSIDATRLINKIVDANVFGSGNLDRDMFPCRPGLTARGEEWLRDRRISYFHEKEKGIVYLHFSSSLSLLSLLSSSRTDEGRYGLPPALEEREADDLRGMLFMFSVCHVLIFLQEGLQFDTQILKKFRMLQNAKHALTPFIRSKIVPALSNSPTNLSVHTAARISSSSPPSRRGVANRQGSPIHLMPGSVNGSSVLPGQCTPVILFVFIGDLLDGSNPSLSPEESVDGPSPTQFSSSGGPSKPTLGSKATSPVVVLARPTSKAEGSLKKKLQLSLEAQLRFLIKRCRTLIGTDHSNLGSRSAASLPLFILDSSKVVVTLDRSVIHRVESLGFITDLIENALNSTTALDIFSLENHCENLNNDDVQAIKDFLYRQADNLRGRGGMPSNTSSGSASGVGMVAAAAAAAAASAASGKHLAVPELPSLELWLSLSNIILNSMFLAENENFKTSSPEKHVSETQDKQISVEDSKAVAASISCLENCKDLNYKFSISWCQRALPAAKEAYLNELPPFYPTSLHRAHLERALHAFRSMVKGPAMETFLRQLEEECTAIWLSGRQLCDTVSLTGKPCMHQRHDEKTQHSSGYVFLHACACGRSRRLRDDPFDFESANITFSCFANCEDLLPTLILPIASHVGCIFQNSWHLTRIAGARYYKPSKGLLQTGFSSSEKYLLKWVISLEKQKQVNSLASSIVDKSSSTTIIPESKLSSVFVNIGADQWQKEPKSGRSENVKTESEMATLNDLSISFGKGLPSFPMKKPFSEVVAGTSSIDPFPSLQQKKTTKASEERSVKKVVAADQTGHLISVADNREGTQKTEHMPTQEIGLRSATNNRTDSNPFLQIGSNIVPVKINSEKNLKDDSLKQVAVFVGFEHECPYGHRFLLSLDHLKDLDYKSSTDGLYSTADDSEQTAQKKIGSYRKDSENLTGTLPAPNYPKRTYRSQEIPAKYNDQHGSMIGSYRKDSENLTGTLPAPNYPKRTYRSQEIPAKYNDQHGSITLSRSDMERFESADGHSVAAGYENKLDRNIFHVRLDNGGSAFSLLNRKLPVYMNCPYCKNPSKKDQKTKFADNISQLQRIFIVSPQFPTVLRTCPVVQFEDSCLPPSTPNREQQSRFTFGCQVVLPPESFITIKLPFIYGVQMDDGRLHPLNHIKHQPEHTAWLVEGTVLQIVSVGHEDDGTMLKDQE